MTDKERIEQEIQEMRTKEYARLSETTGVLNEKEQNLVQQDQLAEAFAKKTKKKIATSVITLLPIVGAVSHNMVRVIEDDLLENVDINIDVAYKFLDKEFPEDLYEATAEHDVDFLRINDAVGYIHEELYGVLTESISSKEYKAGMKPIFKNLIENTEYTADEGMALATAIPATAMALKVFEDKFGFNREQATDIIASHYGL